MKLFKNAHKTCIGPACFPGTNLLLFHKRPRRVEGDWAKTLWLWGLCHMLQSLNQYRLSHQVIEADGVWGFMRHAVLFHFSCKTETFIGNSKGCERSDMFMYHKKMGWNYMDKTPGQKAASPPSPLCSDYLPHLLVCGIWANNTPKITIHKHSWREEVYKPKAPL